MRSSSAVFSALRTGCLALAFAASASQSLAYVLNDTDKCHPGQKWDTSRPVKVRLLADSYSDYLSRRGGQTSFDLVGIDKDIKAVIALNNAIPGNALVLEQGADITGDSNLDSPSNDNFGTQTIVIGFTTATTAPAWTNGDSNDGCTRTRAHIQFRKTTFDWIFGPPDDLVFEKGGSIGRSFYTKSQPRNSGRSGSAISFLGVLTHEMGHAIGLVHPDDGYAVMAQDFKTWFRGKDALVTRYLPDDTAGILALHGISGAKKPLDISVSSTWFESASAQVAKACKIPAANVDAAAQKASDATGLEIGPDFPASGIFKGAYADLFIALANAQNALQVCKDAQNAVQVDNCVVSSRADDWADALSGTVYCGVNKGSAYAPVSNKVCRGRRCKFAMR